MLDDAGKLAAVVVGAILLAVAVLFFVWALLATRRAKSTAADVESKVGMLELENAKLKNSIAVQSRAIASAEVPSNAADGVEENDDALPLQQSGSERENVAIEVTTRSLNEEYYQGTDEGMAGQRKSEPSQSNQIPTVRVSHPSVDVEESDDSFYDDGGSHYAAAVEEVEAAEHALQRAESIIDSNSYERRTSLPNEKLALGEEGSDSPRGYRLPDTHPDVSLTWTDDGENDEVKMTLDPMLITQSSATYTDTGSGLQGSPLVESANQLSIETMARSPYKADYSGRAHHSWIDESSDDETETNGDTLASFRLHNRLANMLAPELNLGWNDSANDAAQGEYYGEEDGSGLVQCSAPEPQAQAAADIAPLTSSAELMMSSRAIEIDAVDDSDRSAGLASFAPDVLNVTPRHPSLPTLETSANASTSNNFDSDAKVVSDQELTKKRKDMSRHVAAEAIGHAVVRHPSLVNYGESDHSKHGTFTDEGTFTPHDDNEKGGIQRNTTRVSIAGSSDIQDATLFNSDDAARQRLSVHKIDHNSIVRSLQIDAEHNAYHTPQPEVHHLDRDILDRYEHSITGVSVDEHVV